MPEKRLQKTRAAYAADSDENWCSATWSHVHRYADWGTWVDHRHPICDMCGYVDESRKLDPIPGTKHAKL